MQNGFTAGRMNDRNKRHIGILTESVTGLEFQAHPFEPARTLISDDVKNEGTLDRRIRCLAFAAIFLAPACPSAFEEQSRSRTFELTYAATVRDIPDGTKVLNLWLPLPQTDRNQTVHRVVIDAPESSHDRAGIPIRQPERSRPGHRHGPLGRHPGPVRHRLAAAA